MAISTLLKNQPKQDSEFKVDINSVSHVYDIIGEGKCSAGIVVVSNVPENTRLVFVDGEANYAEELDAGFKSNSEDEAKAMKELKKLLNKLALVYLVPDVATNGDKELAVFVAPSTKIDTSLYYKVSDVWDQISDGEDVQPISKETEELFKAKIASYQDEKAFYRCFIK